MRETRAVDLTAEVRKQDAEDGKPGELRFVGQAAVFNQRTWIGSKRFGFWEEIDPAFFRDVLSDDGTAFLVNHDPNILLARNKGTMTLKAGKTGLDVDAQWNPDDDEAVRWGKRVSRGDVTKMSFAFTVAEDGDSWRFDEETGQETRRLLTAGSLPDVSLVTYPAYESTSGAMREQAEEVLKRHRDTVSRETRKAPAPYFTPARRLMLKRRGVEMGADVSRINIFK